MKNKLMALVLCLAMLVSMLAVFTACSDKTATEGGEGTEDEPVAKVDGAKTLTLWIITENQKVVDENGELNFSDDVQNAMDRVEAAFSKITKSKYKTNVDIVFKTEEEYYSQLEKAMEANFNRDELVNEAERALMFYINEMEAMIDAGDIPYMNKEAITTQFYIDYADFPSAENSYWIYRDGGAFLPSDEAEVSDKEEYIYNEFGVPELKYPDAGDNQVDIIYISGQDMLDEFIENEYLEALDEDIGSGGVGSLLQDYVAPALLQGIKYNGITYAVPNNVEIGEYTYMYIDKEMYDAFGYGKSFDSSVNIIDCKDFLDDVAGNLGDENSVCYNALPIASNFEEAMSHLVWYWNIGHETAEDDLGNTVYNYPIYTIHDNKDGNVLYNMTAFGALYGDPASASRGQISLGFNNLLTNATYRNILKTLKGYEVNGYYGTPKEGQKAAISFGTGDYSIKGEAAKNGGVYTDELGREYYVSVVKYPEVGEEELYGNMFAVSAKSKNVYASIEIVTALNTNSQLRNILQYGINESDIDTTLVENRNLKGHYRIDEVTGELERVPLNDKGEYYLMDIKKTGNCFVAHPEEGLPADYWEISKNQNGEAVVNPLLGFDFSKELSMTGSSMNVSDLNAIAMSGKYIREKLDSAKTVEELNMMVDALAAQLGSTVTIKYGTEGSSGYMYFFFDADRLTNPTLADDTGVNENPYSVYQNWMVANSYVPAP